VGATGSDCAATRSLFTGEQSRIHQHSRYHGRDMILRSGHGLDDPGATVPVSNERHDHEAIAVTNRAAEMEKLDVGEESRTERARHGFGPSASAGPLVVSSSVSSICIHHRG
jgi:hypothetical protein